MHSQPRQMQEQRHRSGKGMLVPGTDSFVPLRGPRATRQQGQNQIEDTSLKNALIASGSSFGKDLKAGTVLLVIVHHIET